jgi:hypothetical protein
VKDPIKAAWGRLAPSFDAYGRKLPDERAITLGQYREAVKAAERRGASAALKVMVEAGRRMNNAR